MNFYMKKITLISALSAFYTLAATISEKAVGMNIDEAARKASEEALKDKDNTTKKTSLADIVAKLRMIRQK